MLLKNLLYGYYATQCIYAVSELKVAEYLKTGKKSISELASLARCDEKKLYRIMRFLSARGLFDEFPDRIFSLNEQSSFLISSTPGNLKNFIELHGKYFYQGASEIFESLQNELTPFEIRFGKSAGKLFEEQPDIGEVYNVAMQEVSEYYGKLAVKQYDFSSYKTIVDVGGGLGSFLVNILKANKIPNGINFDLPALKKDAESYFKREGLSSRCCYKEGNFFDTIPEGGDLYIFKAIFHGKTDEQASLILKNTKKVLPKAGKILLIDRMITPGENFLDGCLNDINMLNVTKGGVRTFEEYKNLFASNGFSVGKIQPLEDALQIIELKAITYEDYIREHPDVLEKDSVELVPYNPEWPEQAKAEIDKIRRALPAKFILDIEHVGSTAVAGLLAKPIIDIQIAVNSLEEAKLIAVPVLQKMGYEFWSENPDETRLFFVKGMPPYGERRTHHVHIVLPTSHHWKNKLIFRNYLRSHSEAARQYETLKKTLAKNHQYDREKYTDYKLDFITEILKKAEQEGLI